MLPKFHSLQTSRKTHVTHSQTVDEDQKDLVPKLDILIEEVKVDFDFEVKRELSDEEAPADGAADVASDVGDAADVGDVGGVGNVKEEDR